MKKIEYIDKQVHWKKKKKKKKKKKPPTHTHTSITQPAIVGVFSEAVVPSGGQVLVFRGHGCHMGGVHGREVGPQLLQGGQEECVCVHIDQGVHLMQKGLKEGRKVVVVVVVVVVN